MRPTSSAFDCPYSTNYYACPASVLSVVSTSNTSLAFAQPHRLPERPPESWLVSRLILSLSVSFHTQNRPFTDPSAHETIHRKEHPTDIFHHCIDSSTSETSIPGSRRTCRPIEVPSARKSSPGSACRQQKPSSATSLTPFHSRSGLISSESVEKHMLFAWGTWSRTASGLARHFSACETGGSLRYKC